MFEYLPPRAFATIIMLTDYFINLAQKNLNDANATATETSKFVDDANKIAKAALQAANNKAKYIEEWIKNSADENSTVKYLLAIGDERAFNRVKDLEYKVSEVATEGSKRNQYAADRVKVAEETVRLLEEQKQFYETKLAEQKLFYDLSRSY